MRQRTVPLLLTLAAVVGLLVLALWKAPTGFALHHGGAERTLRAAFVGHEPTPSPLELVEMEVATVGVDLLTSTPIALLRSEDWSQVVPIWIGEGEATAIARALQGVEPPRPMTHDLFTSTIREMGGTLVEVQVSGIEGSTFLGQLVIRVENGTASRTVAVDSRPSDALALAVRTNARLKVADHIVQRDPDVDFVALEGMAEVVRIMGLTVGPPTRARAEEYALPDRTGMVILHSSRPVGTGLNRGDLVLDVNGEIPATARDFLRALRLGDPASPSRLIILRDGEESLVELPRDAGARPATTPRRGT
ncbi:MAG: bifunctional nuclease domain-containing protein [Gemmatimonadota bacterium]